MDRQTSDGLLQEAMFNAHPCRKSFGLLVDVIKDLSKQLEESRAEIDKLKSEVHLLKNPYIRSS